MEKRITNSPRRTLDSDKLNWGTTSNPMEEEVGNQGANEISIIPSEFDHHSRFKRGIGKIFKRMLGHTKSTTTTTPAPSTTTSSSRCNIRLPWVRTMFQ